MCWFQRTTSISSTTILSTYNFVLDISSTSANHFAIGTKTNDYNGPLVDNKVWYHGAGVVRLVSSGNQNIFGYLNGALVVNTNDASIFTSNTSIVVGNYTPSATNSFLNGIIKDVKIWTRALSAKEVNLEKRSPQPQSRAGLLCWYPLDDNIIYDKSGNGYTLSPFGTATTLVSGPLLPIY